MVNKKLIQLAFETSLFELGMNKRKVEKVVNLVNTGNEAKAKRIINKARNESKRNKRNRKTA